MHYAQTSVPVTIEAVIPIPVALLATQALKILIVSSTESTDREAEDQTLVKSHLMFGQTFIQPY